MAEKSLIPIAQKKKKELSQCRICGSEAFYSYFGVISCEACKVFFKRNAHYEQVSFFVYKIIHSSKYLSLESIEMFIQWSL